VSLLPSIGRGSSLTLIRDDSATSWRLIPCLEDQANVYGMMRDVGFIDPLTRCRSGLTGMVATRGGYRQTEPDMS
jgi:hypothetical protein